LGVINDTPEPVAYTQFQLFAGRSWGFPAVGTTLQPGEMMQWFLYTRAMQVEASLLLEGDDGRTWSIAVAQHRLGNWFTECDRMRCAVLPGRNLTAAREGMCKTGGKNGAGIRVRGGYQMTVFLNEATLEEAQRQPPQTPCLGLQGIRYWQ